VITLLNGEKIVVRETARTFSNASFDSAAQSCRDHAASGRQVRLSVRLDGSGYPAGENRTLVDTATLVGLVLAIGGIFLGLMLEGEISARCCSRRRP